MVADTSMFVCTHRGSTPIETIGPLLDPSKVHFLLVRVPLGSGSFSRTKFIYIHYAGPTCSVVKRARWNSLLGDAKAVFSTNNGIQIDNPDDELTLDNLLSKLQHVFVVDNGTFSIAQVKEEHARRIQEEEKAREEELARIASLHTAKKGSTDKGDAAVVEVKKRKLAVELGLTEASILKALREETGPINWVLYNYDQKVGPTLVNGGGGGVPELNELLEEGSIQYGLIRMSFGTGRFRRTKYIFFQWAGDAVSAMKKGRAAMDVPAMVEKLGRANAEIQLHGRDSADVASIVRTVEPFFVIDNINVAAGGKKGLTEEEYLAALLEEQNRSAAFFGASSDDGPSGAVLPPPQPTSGYPVSESVSQVLKGKMLWCVLEPAK